MTTGATGQLGLALPVQGELSGTWGDTVNNGITQYTNIAIAATLTLTNDGAVTLANTTGDASASNIVSTLTGAGTVTAQFAIVRVTGTLTVAKVVTAPSYSKTYLVVNAATGGIVTFKAAGQTGVSIAVGESAFVYFNGTDYVKVAGTSAVSSFQTSLSGLTPSTATTGAVTLAGTLGVANGGTGATTLTANNVILGNGTSAPLFVAPGSSGNILTSNGSTWASTAPAGGGVTTFNAGTTGFTPNTATSGAVTLAGTLAPANGGTGVSNNAAMTVTGSGNFAYTRTLTGTTNVTFPTTGTLSTLAGSETLTNKTLTSPTLTTPALGTPASGVLSSCTVDGTDAVGFKNIPQNSQSAAYTLVLADAGKHIFHPVGDNNARTFTIPANSSVAYPIGTAITFINMAAANVTIAITTDTMYLSSAGTTGSRTLAQYGSATAIKITSTNWLISGSGLT